MCEGSRSVRPHYLYEMCIVSETVNFFGDGLKFLEMYKMISVCFLTRDLCGDYE